MSLATALGRYFQLAPKQLKGATVSTIRCKQKGCLLASAVKFDLNGERVRALVVQGMVSDKLKHAGGPNVTAPREPSPYTLEQVQSMAPGDVLNRLRDGSLTERQLEDVYRANGGSKRRIAYLCTRDDFEGHSPNRFARCEHVSGYLSLEHYYVTSRTLRVQDLT